MVERARRVPRRPGAAQVENEAPGGFQYAPDLRCERQEPGDVTLLVYIAVFLLEVERVGRRGDD